MKTTDSKCHTYTQRIVCPGFMTKIKPSIPTDLLLKERTNTAKSHPLHDFQIQLRVLNNNH